MRGEVVRGEVLRGEVLRGEVVRGEVVRGEVLRGEVLRGEVVRGEVVRGEVVRGGGSRRGHHEHRRGRGRRPRRDDAPGGLQQTGPAGPAVASGAGEPAGAGLGDQVTAVLLGDRGGDGRVHEHWLLLSLGPGRVPPGGHCQAAASGSLPGRGGITPLQVTRSRGSNYPHVLAASLSGHSSATSGIAAWLRLLTEPRDPQLLRPTDILA